MKIFLIGLSQRLNINAPARWFLIIAWVLLIFGCMPQPDFKALDAIRVEMDANTDKVAKLRTITRQRALSPTELEELKSLSCSVYTANARLGGTAMLDACASRHFYVSSSEQDNFEMLSKEALVRELKDPDAARFRNVRITEGVLGLPVLCGEVNSKNSYGGYVGFQKFVATPTAYSIEGSEPLAYQRWYSHCRPSETK